jgi:hypothetical protein
LASDSLEDRGSDATPASAIIVTSSGSEKKRRRTNIDLHLSPPSAGDNGKSPRLLIATTHYRSISSVCVVNN